MPPTRSSQTGLGGQSTPSLADIPSERIVADVERLCRRWDIPIRGFLCFFGVTCLTPKLLSALRDLRARVTWDTAKVLLEAVRDDDNTAKGGTGDRRTRSSGPGRIYRDWSVEDVNAAIRRADADRPASAQRTRARQVSGVPTPEGQTSPSIRSQTNAENQPVNEKYQTPTKSRTPGDTKAEEGEETGPSGDVPVAARKKRGAVIKDNVKGENDDKDLVDDADDEKTHPPKRKRLYGRTRTIMHTPSTPEKKYQPKQDPSMPDKSLEIPDSEPESLATTSCPSTPWPKSLCRTLSPETWLNDEAVHGIISMLASASPTSSNTVVVSTLLITRESTEPARALTSALANNPEMLLLPMHLGNHWALLVVRPKSRTAELFDSMPTFANQNRVKEIFKRFAGIYLDGDEPVSWEVAEKPCPEQGNDYDCGVFTIAVAAHILAGRPPPTKLAADPWRHTCCLLADPELAGGAGAFAEFFNPPMSEKAPEVQPQGNNDDVMAFQEVREAWIDHFERRTAQLTKSVSDLWELDAVQATLAGCLVNLPREGNPQDDRGSKLERELRNVEREMDLRTQLSALPECEQEKHAIPALRKKQARLRQQLERETSRDDARGRIRMVLSVLERQKAEKDATYKKTISRLNEYRRLFELISSTEGPYQS